MRDIVLYSSLKIVYWVYFVANQQFEKKPIECNFNKTIV